MPQPLNYQPQMRITRRSRWIRAGIWIAAILLFQIVIVLLFHPLVEDSEKQEYLGGGIIGTPAAPINYDDAQHFDKTTYAIQAGGYLLVLLLTQWLFLRQHGSWRLDKIGGDKLTRTSAIIAGLFAMLLCIGLLATLMELPGWWYEFTGMNVAAESDNIHQDFTGVWTIMFIFWTFWAWNFWIYGRTLDRYTFTGKILHWLFAGTVLELLISAPAHAWVVRTRGDECYCTRGSYTGVVFGMTALVWLFGPGVWFYLQREKRRRERLELPESSSK